MGINTKSSPLVVIAFDAGDPNFFLQWVKEGSLPTVGALMQQGGWGRIADPEQLSEWGTWTSLLSGTSRSRHGFYYFRQLVPGTYDLRLFSPPDTGVSPFWAHLRGRGKNVAIIDAPESELVPGLSGLQLADTADPPEVLHEARRVFGRQITVNDFSPRQDLNEDRGVYHRLLERVEKKGTLCRHLLAKDHFDLVVIGFYEAHDAAHRFWDYRSETRVGRDGAQTGELASAIRTVYQAIDRQIGLVLEELPSTANVFVVSCYGMEALYPTTGLMDMFFPRLGYQAASSPESLGPSIRLRSLPRRLAPRSWRVALHQHLPVRIQERLLAAQFRNSTNWSEAAAFAIPSLFTSFIRVNLRGREPQGIVSPGDAYTTLLTRLEEDLQQLVDPRTRAPAVSRVTRTAPVFGLAPPEVLPDLFVEWQSSPHFLARVVHPSAELVQQQPSYFRGSYHSHEGFLAAAGPSIGIRGNLGHIAVLDLAPTFLSLLGVPIPRALAGEVMRGVARS
jgi:predicted AlkP superfamily phosphohydrolase/phosphomutase